MDSQEWRCAAGPGSEERAAPETGEIVNGRVKWFDAVKGFGFLVPDDGSGDVLLHYNLLATYGCKTLPEGALLGAMVINADRGRQAVSLIGVEQIPRETPVRRAPKLAANRSTPLDFLDVAGDFEPVEVRWFNRAKGYGFLLRGDGVTQVFIHMETVRRAGFAGLQPGDRCEARIHDGPRGALAVVLQAAQA